MSQSSDRNNVDKVGFGAWIFGALFLVSPLLWSDLSPNDYSGGSSRDADAAVARNASAVGIMLGEFRTSFSDILVIKTERYLHSGVGYVAHSQGESQGVQSQMENLDAHQEDVGVTHENAGDGHEAQTLIRAPGADFRGLIGELEREVKPFNDASTHAMHTDGKQILPWFRLATLSDGQHIRAYTIGAYWLGNFDRKEAEAFLKEGLETNPEAYQLHLVLGFNYLRQTREMEGDLFDPTPEQKEVLEKCQASFHAAAEYALEQRPHGFVTDNKDWGHYEEDDAWAAFRMAVMTEKFYGSEEKAVELAKRILKTAGEERTLMRVVQDAESAEE